MPVVTLLRPCLGFLNAECQLVQLTSVTVTLQLYCSLKEQDLFQEGPCHFRYL